MNTWQCCGKVYVKGVKSCRVCKKAQPVYGFVNDEKKPTASKKQHNPNDLSRVRDPLISKDEEKLYVSTIKMKDGKTIEDLKNGKK